MTPGAHQKYTAEGQAISIALCGNAAEIVPELVKRGVRPDMVTDQTSAHDPLHGYLPKGWSWEEYQQKAESDPQGTILAAKRSMADHVQAMLAFHEMGSQPSTTATTSARWRRKWASATPSISRASCRPISAAVLPRYRPVPLGSAVRRSAGYLQNRRESERDH